MFRSAPAPRWLTLVLGIAAIAAGALLTLKPYSSLTALTLFLGAALIVTGLGGLFDDAPDSFWEIVSSIALIVLGIAAMLLREQTVRVLAIAVGAGLIASGLIRIKGGVHGSTGDRYLALVGGAAMVILGIVALAWPDVSILALGLIVGPVAVIFGVLRTWRALFGSADAAATKRVGDVVGKDDQPQGWRKFARFGSVTLALALTLALIGVSARLHDQAPTVDAFYAAPNDLPATVGQLIRSEPFEGELPEGSRGWKILYTTTGLDGGIISASGLVVVPEAEATEPLPVVLWAHGTTGVARGCAPSNLDTVLSSGAMPAQNLVIEAGWAIVAPDYLGLGGEGKHPYLVGRPSAQSSLDAVRAARQLDQANLGEQTVVWGHSQGGAVALWIGIESSTYAPDVPLLGVAALAPASDLPNLGPEMLGSLGGPLFGAYILYGYEAAYSDVHVNDYIRPTAREVVESLHERCLSEPAMLVTGVELIAGNTMDTVFEGDPIRGALAQRFAENVPITPTGIPTLIGQGAGDTLIDPDVQSAYVANYCDAGQIIDFRSYAGRDHASIVAEDSPMIPELMEWTAARFAGEAAPTACSTLER